MTVMIQTRLSRMCSSGLCCLKCAILSKLKYVIYIFVIMISIFIALISISLIKRHLLALHLYAPKCASKPTRINMDSLKCPFTSFEEIALSHDASAPIILTYANAAWINITHNFICHAKESGLSRILVVALSDGVCDKLSGVLCLYPNITTNSDVILNTKHATKEGNWGSTVYQNLLQWRTPILYSILKCNRTLLVADNDVVFLRNPLFYLQGLVQSGGYDVMFQRDAVGIYFLDRLAEKEWLGNFIVCAGFMYLRPTRASFSLIQGIMAYQELDWNDQAGINTCLLYQPKMGTLKWRTLPSSLFPNGEMLKRGIDRSRTVLKPFLYHFNWHHWVRSKILLMKKLRLWCGYK